MERDIEEYLFYLHILEGSGLNERNQAIVIAASLGGNQLETEIVQFTEGCEAIVFNSNLIWETDKKSIKNMKTENLPIKIECYSIIWKNKQEVRTLIGYILLPIRGVPICIQKKPMQGKPQWHKLIGVASEWRSKKPQILLFLGITHKQNLIQDNLFKTSHADKLHQPPLEVRNTSSMLQSQQGMYIKLLQDEGLLQVGDSNLDCDIFIIKLMFKHAAHLEHIVNPEERMNKLFRLHYNLLGTPTYCSLTPKGDGTYSIQEKIAIHFKSSLSSLQYYFDKILYIPIDLYYNETVVGHAVFKFANFIKSHDLITFQNLYGDNNNIQEEEGIFNIEPLFDLPPTAINPFVVYNFSLRYMSTARIGNCEIIVDRPQVAEYIDNLAGGDTNEEKTMELRPTNRSIEEDNEINSEPRYIYSDTVLFLAHNENEKQNNFQKSIKSSVKSTRSVPDTVTPNCPENVNIESLPSAKQSSRNIKEIPRTFGYNLVLQSIKFTRRPEIGIWQISFHHSKADTPFTVVNAELSGMSSNLIEFENLELQLFFASTPSQILNIVESAPCTLKILGPRGMQAMAELDNEILLLNVNDKKSGVILMENETGEKIAMAHIFVYLSDIGINFNSQLKNHSHIEEALSKPNIKPYFDENLAYSIVEELEEWKQKQQEQFLIELKRKEIYHLAQLTAEWKKRKFDQETKLQEKLEQCTTLTAALEEAYNIIKEKGYDQLEQTKICEQIRMECEQTYSAKFIEFNEKIRRLENDSDHQLKLAELKYFELEINKNHIESENEKLKLEIDELKQKILEMQKTYLPREQLAGLFQDVRILSERLEEVQKSKDFYKDQWAKIIREVHNMKSDELRKMELHLKKTTSLGLREFLKDEHSELLTEMEELNFIKSMLNTNDDILKDSSKEKDKKKPADTSLINTIC